MLINCVAYQEGKKLSDIPVEDISEYLKLPETFVWVALRDPDQGEIATMQEEFKLHELAVEDAARGHQRPKMEEYGDCVFMTLHIMELNGDEVSAGEHALKRKSQVLRHAVVPLMDAIGRLHGGRVPDVVIETQDYLRDVHDHLLRILGRLDTVRDTINTAIQVTLSMVAIEENDISKKLASYAAIFAVFTAFAGIWGMNFEFMPELKWKYGYPVALCTMAGVCGYLYWRFKKSGWI